MKWSKTMMAMVAVLVLSGLAAVLEMQGRHQRNGAETSSSPASEAIESAPVAPQVAPSRPAPPGVIVG